jgi:Bacterial transcriptional activator domain
LKLRRINRETRGVGHVFDRGADLVCSSDHGELKDSWCPRAETTSAKFEHTGCELFASIPGAGSSDENLNDLEVAVTRQVIPTIRSLYAKLAPGIDLSPLEEAREQWHERILETLLEQVRNNADNEATLELILELDPLHEEACSLLLTRLIRTGRRITAQRRYRDFSCRLQDTLGLEPAPELQALVTGKRSVA